MFEGTLREYERVNGKFKDLSIYSKLETDRFDLFIFVELASQVRRFLQ